MICKAPPLLCRKRQANRILYSMKDGSSVSATESLSPGFIASDVLYIEKSVLHFQNMTRRKDQVIILKKRPWLSRCIQEQHPFFPGISSWSLDLSIVEFFKDACYEVFFILISLPIVGTRNGEIMFMNYEASDITITGSQQPKSWTVSAWTRPLRYLWSESLIFIVLFWDIVEILPSSFLTSIAFQYQELTEYIASFVATQYDEIKMCS